MLNEKQARYIANQIVANGYSIYGRRNTEELTDIIFTAAKFKDYEQFLDNNDQLVQKCVSTIAEIVSKSYQQEAITDTPIDISENMFSDDIEAVDDVSKAVGW